MHETRCSGSNPWVTLRTYKLYKGRKGKCQESKTELQLQLARMVAHFPQPLRISCGTNWEACDVEKGADFHQARHSVAGPISVSGPGEPRFFPSLAGRPTGCSS